MSLKEPSKDDLYKDINRLENQINEQRSADKERRKRDEEREVVLGGIGAIMIFVGLLSGGTGFIIFFAGARGASALLLFASAVLCFAGLYLAKLSR
jgi:hypothetical protein